MTFSIFGALGECEWSLIIERIRSCIARAKMQGRKFGRPRVYGDEVSERVIELRAGSQGVLARQPYRITNRVIASDIDLTSRWRRLDAATVRMVAQEAR